MFDNRWYRAIPTGTGRAFTKAELRAAVRQVYDGYPELMNIALKQLK